MRQVWCDYWDSSHFAPLSRGSPPALSPPLTPPSPLPWSPEYRPAPSSLSMIPSPNRSNDEKVTLWVACWLKCCLRCEPTLFSCLCICGTFWRTKSFVLKGQNYLSAAFFWHFQTNVQKTFFCFFLYILWAAKLCHTSGLVLKMPFKSLCKSSTDMLYGVLIGTVNTAWSEVYMVQ